MLSKNRALMLLMALWLPEWSLDKVAYNEDWEIVENDLTLLRSIKADLASTVGHMGTAHARWALFQPGLQIIKELGADYIIYNDTDSYKCRKHPKVLEIFETYNKWIGQKASGLRD